MKNTSVVLGKEHTAFIRKQVRKGRFGSASEAIRAGLTLLEEQELKLERLRSALEEGEKSGEPQPFDVDAFVTEKKRAR
jgi:antitoxin ParD1/3/4